MKDAIKRWAMPVGLALSLGLNAYAMYRVAEVEESIPASSIYSTDDLADGLDELQRHINRQQGELDDLDRQVRAMRLPPPGY